MNALKSLLVLSAIVLASASAEASRITLGEPAYGGNGCPAGSASVTTTGDGTTMSVLFDSFAAEAGNTTGRRVDRKSCNLRVPVRVPNGYSVALIGVDYRGFNAIPGAGAYNDFRAEYFYAGSRGPVFQKRFVGPQADSFQIRNNLIASNLIWSACSKEVIFSINASATSMSNSRMEQTMMIVDSIDISAGMLYHFQLRRCN
ncbi:DUF4360 domain-containing protein [Pseudobdellovibrio sp. HCB154]|uniref:DUF4360 domain-containing protein n=1 Tax=Pseudobdellovibrio sp. HCB154 TaxID=3386277 RepID=UPI003916DF8D